VLIYILSLKFCVPHCPGVACTRYNLTQWCLGNRTRVLRSSSAVCTITNTGNMSAEPQTFHQFWCLNYWSACITFLVNSM